MPTTRARPGDRSKAPARRCVEPALALGDQTRTRPAASRRARRRARPHGGAPASRPPRPACRRARPRRAPPPARASNGGDRRVLQRPGQRLLGDHDHGDPARALIAAPSPCRPTAPRTSPAPSRSPSSARRAAGTRPRPRRSASPRPRRGSTISSGQPKRRSRIPRSASARRGRPASARGRRAAARRGAAARAPRARFAIRACSGQAPRLSRRGRPSTGRHRRRSPVRPPTAARPGSSEPSQSMKQTRSARGGVETGGARRAEPAARLDDDLGAEARAPARRSRRWSRCRRRSGESRAGTQPRTPGIASASSSTGRTTSITTPTRASAVLQPAYALVSQFVTSNRDACPRMESATISREPLCEVTPRRAVPGGASLRGRR